MGFITTRNGVEIKINIALDEIDEKILSIIEKNPKKGWKVNQILPILEDSGYNLNYAKLCRKMDTLCILTLLEKKKEGGKVFRYYLP
jgi:hypothetical protein